MTERVKIGDAFIGGGESVKVQSMCTTKTSRVDETAEQIRRLEEAGCDIVRVSVLDDEDAAAIPEIKSRISIPLVADIHFSARLAVKAIEGGCDKIRINPGNIGGEKERDLVADCVKAHGIPVRVGANSGSLEKGYLEKYGSVSHAMVESALDAARVFEKRGVRDIVLSVKSSSAPVCVKAYRELSTRCDYPLHVGVTEGGTYDYSVSKSAAAIGSLLMDGIGDTIRVSISGDPVREVAAARRILRSVELDRDFVELVACPTCGRCEWDCAAFAEKVQKRIENVKKPLKIAVMGCVVNGPGETRDCNLGIAGAKGGCAIYEFGKVSVTLPQEKAEEEFFKRLEELIDD